VSTRAEVEDFLYADADLLDSWRLDDWLGTLTFDATYEVPSVDARGGGPADSLMLVADDRAMIEARVKRLNSRKAHREFPWSRTRRIVGNVRLSGSDGLTVDANFAIYRTRRSDTSVYVGRYKLELVPGGGTFLIRRRRAELEMESLDPHGTLSIIV
jgi:p-cumate 2,3-dioxygenase subunit beta